MDDDNKPTLYLLMQQHGLGMAELVGASEVSSFVVWEMINGHPVKHIDAERIINGVNMLQHTHYTLDAIWCPVQGEAS